MRERDRDLYMCFMMVTVRKSRGARAREGVSLEDER